MTNAKEQYDLAVLGAGPGGYVAALRASQLGWRTAVIEKDRPGGVCLNWGCIPTKAILASAELYRAIGGGEEFGIECGTPDVDYAKVIKRSRDVSARLVRGIKALFKKSRVEIISGTGTILEEGDLVVESGADAGRMVGARHILVATGSQESLLPGLSPEDPGIMTSREALECTEIPESILVIGGGAVGLEFAYIYASFGSRVYLVEMEDQLLPGLDSEVAAALERSLRRKGIKIHTRTAYRGRSDSAGAVVVLCEGPDGGEKTFTVDKVLVAVGRKANTGSIGLDKVGVKQEGGFVKVDGCGRTDAEGIWAVGDVIGPPLLAHAASEEGVAAVEIMAGARERGVEYGILPACVYCHPEVATVGQSEEDARRSGRDLQVGRFPFQALGKAVGEGKREGFTKVIADAADGRILGCHIIGKGATELIAECAVAMRAGLSAGDLGATVHAHPTLSEAVKEAALAAAGKALHI